MEIANEIRSVYGKIKKQVSRLFLKRRVVFAFWDKYYLRSAMLFLATGMLTATVFQYESRLLRHYVWVCARAS